MDSKKIAEEITRCPAIYMPILKFVNAAALVIGWVRSLFRKD